MKMMKIYIVTYKRSDILNDTLTKLFESDFSDLQNTQVNIINNHTNFNLKPEFEGRVKVLHNVLRPDWSNGNLAENWNQALLDGFRNLNTPDAEYVVTLQNDTSLHPTWCSNMLNVFKQGYNFIVGSIGDNVVGYTADAVKRIGMWDENFAGICYKEADYWLRAMIHNKEMSCINDISHGITLNNHVALPLDTTIDRNVVTLNEKREGFQVIKRKADDDEHRKIWQAGRGGIFKEHEWRYFKYKWSGTHKTAPQKHGWIKYWSDEFKNSPPDMTQSKMKTIMRYVYFEKDIYDLKGKNYLL